jgi:hypothetical protein
VTIWCIRTACWTNTHSEYVILTAFPLQQCLIEHVSVLGYTHTACLVYCHCYWESFWHILFHEQILATVWETLMDSQVPLSMKAINITQQEIQLHWAMSNLHNSRRVGEANFQATVSFWLIETSHDRSKNGINMGYHLRFKSQISKTPS